MPRMGRKKEEHKVPRVPVQMPKPFHDLARKMARSKKQPMLWLLLTLLAEEADREGVERPALPWEEETDDA